MANTAETEVPLLSADPPELETLEIEINGPVGTLTLNRPEALNAMSPELIGELTIAAAWLADRAPLRALIVTGAGAPSARAATSTGSSEGSPMRTSTSPRRFGAAPRRSTTPSSTFAGSPIR